MINLIPPGLLTDSGAMVVSIVGLILAALNCFFGYRMQKVWISLVGFFLGASLGYWIADCLGAALWIRYISLLLGGLVGGFISFRIYRLGVFVLALGMSALFAAYWIPLEGWELAASCLLVGVIVGCLALKFVRPVVILTTGVEGGFAFVQIVVDLLGMSQTLSSAGMMWLPVAISALLALTGVCIQFKKS